MSLGKKGMDIGFGDAINAPLCKEKAKMPILKQVYLSTFFIIKIKDVSYL